MRGKYSNKYLKVVIAGSRSFNDRLYLFGSCDQVLSGYLAAEDIEIVSGTASGADKLGEIYAEDNEYDLKQFPADWETHGKAAGPIRNREMAEYGDILIAFWDKESAGTKSMINEAVKHSLDVHIFTNW